MLITGCREPKSLGARIESPYGRCSQAALRRRAVLEVIQERVRAGLRNAKLKGTTLGRPRRVVSGDQMVRLREQGASFREIAKAVGVSPGTVRTRLRQGG